MIPPEGEVAIGKLKGMQVARAGSDVSITDSNRGESIVF
jgi:hypothetical protein